MDTMDLMDLFFTFEIIAGIIGGVIALAGFSITLGQLLTEEED